MRTAVWQLRQCLALLAVAATFSGCGGSSSTAPPSTNPDGSSGTVASVAISPTTLSLHAGDTSPLTATALSAAGGVLTGKAFVWQSSNTSVATVVVSGVVTALAAGTATITVSSEGHSASAVVTVVPAPVTNAAAVFSKISAGLHHTCALTAAGKAYCWGDSTYGATGTGDLLASKTPRAVAGNLTFTSISAGGVHTCALVATGEAYCWGRNLEGELGDGTTALRRAPVLVGGGIKFVSITTSNEAEHSCGLTAAGNAYCWGFNGAGQLGDNTTVTRVAPVPVTGGLTFVSLSAGIAHTCGLTAAGKAYCWGAGSALGDGVGVSRSVPTPLAGNLSFKSLVVGGQGGCGIAGNDVAYCWGTATVPGGTNTPVPAAATGQTYTMLAPAERFTCGISSTGTVYCSGQNDYGQLGDGTVLGRSTAAPIKSSLTFAFVTTNGWHTCGLTPSGATYCWGLNDSGEVGTGAFTQGSSWTPQAVKSP